MTRETHGHTTVRAGRRSPEYTSWRSMKDRCLNPDDYHKNYARVKICDRWKDSFEAFLEDVGPRPSLDHTLDRIDNSRGYEPGNCRWATRKEQACNRRNNVIPGTSVVDVCEELGIPIERFKSRRKRGASIEECLDPKRRNNPNRS